MPDHEDTGIEECGPWVPGPDAVRLPTALFDIDVNGKWALVPDDFPVAIAADWDEWVALANAIVAIDEIKRRQENGDIG